jgi:hypothetical protein
MVGSIKRATIKVFGGNLGCPFIVVLLYVANVANFLIEKSTSVYADLYVTLVRRTEPMGKEPRYSLTGR